MTKPQHHRPAVVALPVSRPASGSSGLVGRLAARLLILVGGCLDRCRLPGAIRPVRVEDPLTGQNLAVHVGTLFVRISVDGRDYYFDRLTGRFDGTGMGCR